MNDLQGAVAKTMNFVFADIDGAAGDKKKRLLALKANLGKVATIPIAEIETSENVRQSIDTSSPKFRQLVESVKKYGVMENVVAELQINKKETDYKLMCVAGHRRILAALAAKNITKIPCLLVAYENKGDKVGAALAENLNREDLHCLDVADGYQQLIESGWDEAELAKHFCRDIRTVKHYLKMAQWSPEVKTLLRKNEEVFSTRVIMRQFAYRKYEGDAQLKNSIKKMLEPAAKKVKTRSKVVAPVMSNAKVKESLEKYLAKQKVLSSLIKSEIRKAFVELKLI
jgi:ParB/RepB/Spo0J family partition protein